MATEKATEKATRRKSKRAKGESQASREDRQSALRLRTDPRSERRYLPAASMSASISIGGAWVAAALVGAGLYGQWLRAAALGPHKAAPYLLVAGAIGLLAIALFGQREGKAIRVGDAGVGVEKDALIERIAWCDLTKVVLAHDALTLQAGGGRALTIPMVGQPQALARALSEARARIPKKVEEVDNADPPPIDPAAGDKLPLDPPQVAGQRCKATDKLIAFERDARLCGKCGELYHKDGVPKRCETCNAFLHA